MTIRAGVFLIIALITIAIVAYWPTYQNEFSMDDTAVISGNLDLHEVQNFSWFYSKDAYFEFSREASYRPVVTLTHLFDSRVWDETGGHIFNLVLHAGVGILMALIGVRLGMPPVASFIGAALFIVHPAWSEAVYVITYREDVLCTFFVLLSLRLLLSGSVWAAQIPFLLALFSKEMAAPFPVALWILNRWKPGFIGRRQFAALWGANILYLFVRFYVFPSPNVPLEHPSFTHWAPAEIRILMNYVRLMVWPDFLSIDHRTSVPVAASFGVYLAGSTIAIFAAYAGWIMWKRRTLNLFLFGWGAVMSMPVWNVITTLNESAERFMYLPMIFPCLGLAGLFHCHVIEGRTRRRLGWTVVMIILAALTIRTHIRGYDYRTYIGLLQKELETNKKCAICAYVLSLEHEMLKEYGTAREWAEAALRINPEFYPAHLFLARADMANNRLGDARKHLDEVLRTQPIDADVALHVAAYYMKAGDTPTAQAWAANAAFTRPRWPSQMIYDILRDIQGQIATQVYSNAPGSRDTSVVRTDTPSAPVRPSP